MVSQNSKIKILFLMEDLNTAGAQRQTVDLINELPKDKFSCTLFTFGYKQHLLNDLDTKNIEFCNYPRRYKLDLKFVFRLVNLMKSREFQILHCTLDWAYIVGAIARRMSGSSCKYIAAIHSSELISRKSRYWAAAYLPIIRRSDQIVFVAENQRNLWVKKFKLPGENCRVIHNGVEEEKFTLVDPVGQGRNSLRAKLGMSSEDFIIGMVARFRPEKRHDLAIKAFSLARRCNKYLKMVCIGDGEKLEQMKLYACESGNESDILFLGQQYPILPFLHTFDCLILSSSIETFSIATLEAMSAGLPVVSPDIGGQNEMICDGYNGFLFPIGDWQALSKCMIKLASDRRNAENMGKKGREIFLSKFTLRTMATKYSNLFTELLRGDDVIN